MRAAILEVIINLRKESGISFLYVTHDLSTAHHVADDPIVLVKRGAVREDAA